MDIKSVESLCAIGVCLLLTNNTPIISIAESFLAMSCNESKETRRRRMSGNRNNNDRCINRVACMMNSELGKINGDEDDDYD